MGDTLSAASCASNAELAKAPGLVNGNASAPRDEAGPGAAACAWAAWAWAAAAAGGGALAEPEPEAGEPERRFATCPCVWPT